MLMMLLTLLQDRIAAIVGCVPVADLFVHDVFVLNALLLWFGVYQTSSNSHLCSLLLNDMCDMPKLNIMEMVHVFLM